MVTRSETEWHLDKRIPLALVLALCIQAAVGISWASRIHFELIELKKDVGALNKATDKLQADRLRQLLERLRRLEDANRSQVTGKGRL